MNDETRKALEESDIATINKLLTLGQFDIHAQDEAGRGPLHYAACNNRADLVKVFLKNGADILATTKKNNTALHLAVSKKQNEVTQAILENVERKKLRQLLDARTSGTGMAVIHVAASNDWYEEISCLLRHGANYEIKTFADQMPTNLASAQFIKDYFNTIDECFKLAKTGTSEFTLALDNCHKKYLASLLNCRNNEGHTLLQVLVLNDHYFEANEILWTRTNDGTIRSSEPLHDPKRIEEIKQLAKLSREFRDLWSNHQATMTTYPSDDEDHKVPILTDDACKLTCQALRKAHEVYLAYRQFEGTSRCITLDPMMRSVEEVLEVLGFDSTQLCVVESQEDCYYDKLPSKYKEKPQSFVDLMEAVVDASFDFFLGYLNSLMTFAAARDNDADRIDQLIQMNVVTNATDDNNYTPLCYAAKHGNEKMLRLLMNSTSRTVRIGSVSPLYLACAGKHAKIVDLLLNDIDERELKTFIDSPTGEDNWTALHVAAEHGHLEITKNLLRNQATYCIVDSLGRTPNDLTTNQQIKHLFKLIDDCFNYVKRRDPALATTLDKLTDSVFMSVIGTRDKKGRKIVEYIDKGFRELEESIAKRHDRIVLNEI